MAIIPFQQKREEEHCKEDLMGIESWGLGKIEDLASMPMRCRP